MTSEQTQPGWYPDPTDPARVRYWNGEQWSVETRDRFAPPIPDASEAAPGPRVVRRRTGSTASTRPDLASSTPGAEPDQGAVGQKVSAPWRLLAGLVDALICTPLGIVAAWPVVYKVMQAMLKAEREHTPLDAAVHLDQPDMVLVALATAAVWFCYGVFFTRYTSGTPGQLLVGARVVNEDGSHPVSWAAAARRSFVRGLVAVLFIGAYSFMAMLVGWLAVMYSVMSIQSTPDGRSLFDVTGGTRVVRRR